MLPAELCWRTAFFGEGSPVLGSINRVEVIARIKRVVALEEIRGAVDVVGPDLSRG